MQSISGMLQLPAIINYRYVAKNNKTDVEGTITALPIVVYMTYMFGSTLFIGLLGLSISFHS
jgi:hypothetical protein